MDPNFNQSNIKKKKFLHQLGTYYAGALTPIALSATGTWMVVTGIKGLAGFNVTTQSASADLIGIVLVIAVLRWLKPRA